MKYVLSIMLFCTICSAHAGKLTNTTADVQTRLTQATIAYNWGNHATNGYLSSPVNIAHGLIYIHDGTNTLTTAVATNYYHVQFFTTNAANITYSNVTLTTSNIVLTIPGVYFLDASLSFIGYNADTYEASLFIDDTHNDVGEANITAVSSSTSTELSLHSSCVVTTNNKVSLRILGSGNHTITIKQAVIRAYKIN